MKSYIAQVGMILRWGHQMHEEICPPLTAEGLGDNKPMVVIEDDSIRNRQSGIQPGHQCGIQTADRFGDERKPCGKGT